MLSILKFELKFWSARSVVYLSFLSLFLLAFLSTAITKLNIGNSTGNTFINAPVIIDKTILIVSAVGMLLTASVMSTSLHKDLQTGFYKIYYSLPLSRVDYFLGKYVSGFLAIFITLLSIPLGIYIATLMPWLDANAVDSFKLYNYLQPIILWMLPNVFLLSGFFFGMVSVTKNGQAAYVSAVILYALYLISYFSVSRFNDHSIAALLDPFGILTEEYVTNYWTLEEQNTKMVSLSGMVLWNRLLYVGIGLVSLIAGYVCLKINAEFDTSGKRKPSRKSTVQHSTIEVESDFVVEPVWMIKTKQILNRAWMEFKMTISNRFFLIILLATFLVLLITNWFLYAYFGVPVEKFTSAMLEAKEGPFPMFVFLVLIIYAADLIHRDKKQGFSEINDSLPVSDSIFLVSKIMNLFYITALMFSTIIVAGILVQVFSGFYNIDMSLYIIDNFLFSLPIYFFFAFIIFFIHAITPNAYIGHGIVILFWIVRGSLLSLGYESHLIHFGRLPEHFYSEVNGFFPFSLTTFWFFTYWLTVSLIMTKVALYFWKRGEYAKWKHKSHGASNKNGKWSWVALSTLFVGIGGFLYYQVEMHNDSITVQQRLDRIKLKKEKYSNLASVQQPSIVKIDIAADHAPAERKHQFYLNYTLVNEFEKPIDTLVVNMPPRDAFEYQILSTELKSLQSDPELGLHVYRLNDVLNEGDSIDLEFNVNYRILGFDDLAFNHQILPNQSYFSAHDFPRLGIVPEKNKIDLNLDIKVDKSYQIVTSGMLVNQQENGPKNKNSYQYSGFSEFGWYINKNMADISSVQNELKGTVYYSEDYGLNAKVAHKAIHEAVDFLFDNDLQYPTSQISVVQQARGFVNNINRHPGIVGINEMFSWRMPMVKADQFDFMTFYVAKEIFASYLEHQWADKSTSHTRFFIDAMAQYMAFDFQNESSNTGTIQYISNRHNKYLSERPKQKSDDLNQTVDPLLNPSKGFLSLIGISRKIGNRKFNEILYTYLSDLQHVSSDSMDWEKEFFDRLYSNIDSEHAVFVRSALQQHLVYDNVIEEALVENDANGFNNNIRIKMEPKGGEIHETADFESYELRFYGSGGKVLSTEMVNLVKGINELEIQTSEKPEYVELDPYHTVIDLNRNNNTHTIY